MASEAGGGIQASAPDGLAEGDSMAAFMVKLSLKFSPAARSQSRGKRPSPRSSVFHILLYEPEIPPNTGNSIRLCANTGAHLHLIGKLGFDLSEPQLKRAGLDYHDLARVSRHADLASCLAAIGPTRLYVVETDGACGFHDMRYQPGDSFLFGRETSGLPAAITAELPQGHVRVRIPMQPSNRSLNLSNAVAVVVYEAWRQNGFAGAGPASSGRAGVIEG
jgi:tRNA (cytidine/uridine-2'-O-)-methyltransferase